MYYLMWRGKITGPFSADKIKKMLKGGQISSLYKMSEDRISWKSVSQMHVNIEPPSSTPPPEENTITPEQQSSQLERGDSIVANPPPTITIRAPSTHLENAGNEERITATVNKKRQAAFVCPLCGADMEDASHEGQGLLCRSCDSIIPLTSSHAESHNEACSDVKKFPDYEIDSVLGVGGMGVVYKARQSRLGGREVALKILTEKFANGSGLQNEMSALVRLAHSSIVTIFDLVSNDHESAIVMELILGPGNAPLSLREIMEINQPLSSYKAALKTCQVICKALSYAHQQGVFHLDLKPENVLVDQHGHLKLVDFGIAKCDASLDSRNRDNQTVSSDRYGTVGYAAPERRMSNIQPNATQDVYSLGVVLYELLVGYIPEGRFDFPSEINQAMPSVLDVLVEKSLNFHPERRYASMDEFDHALQNALKVVDAGTSRSKKIPFSKTNSSPVKLAGKKNEPVSISIKNSKISFGSDT